MSRVRKFSSTVGTLTDITVAEEVTVKGNDEDRAEVTVTSSVYSALDKVTPIHQTVKTLSPAEIVNMFGYHDAQTVVYVLLQEEGFIWEP